MWFGDGFKGRLKMSKLEIAKEVVKDNFKFAYGGIFNTRNNTGDEMVHVYYNNGLIIDICYYYAYFEVFGLSPDEFKELESFYNSLQNDCEG